MATESTTAQPPVPFLKLKEIAHEVRAVFPKPSAPAAQFKITLFTSLSLTNGGADTVNPI